MINRTRTFFAYCQKKVVGRVNGNGRRSTTTTVGACATDGSRQHYVAIG